MHIRILAVGSIKEAYFRNAIDEYKKRLGRYCKLEIVELKDEKTSEKASDAQNEKLRSVEAERIMSKLSKDDFVVVLAIDGHKLSSTSFAKKIEDWEVKSASKLSFIIGGSIGLAESVYRRADYSLSFSDMTFPHQLMRVILLEQIYRAYRIKNNEPYHK